MENFLWMFMWCCTMVVFIALPFCTSKRRREMCKQGIRERRWIRDEEYPEDFDETPVTQARRQQQQREETQRRFRTTKTQEDAIRQQYLSYLMENYTISLGESDIYDNEATETKGAEYTDDSSCSDEKERGDLHHKLENHCDATVISSNIGSFDSRDTFDTKNSRTDIEALSETDTPVRESRANSEDSNGLLEFEFDNGQQVRVPLAGQAVGNGSTACIPPERRVVSNGCAICLCPFNEGEEITWSSNPDCCHVFHNDCIVNWYLAVGRKAQKRRKRDNPDMTDEEALDTICAFPVLCPCCRQEFCINEEASPIGERDEETGNILGDREMNANTN